MNHCTLLTEYYHSRFQQYQALLIYMIMWQIETIYTNTCWFGFGVQLTAFQFGHGEVIDTGLEVTTRRSVLVGVDCPLLKDAAPPILGDQV